MRLHTKLTELLLTHGSAMPCLLYGSVNSLMNVFEGVVSPSRNLYKCKHHCFITVVCVFCLLLLGFPFFCLQFFMLVFVFLFTCLKLFMMVFVFLFTCLKLFMLVFVVCIFVYLLTIFYAGVCCLYFCSLVCNFFAGVCGLYFCLLV